MKDSDSTIIITNNVGAVAAFLTCFEFVVGTIGAICVGSILQGVWLTHLQVKRKITLKKSSLKKRILLHNIIALIIGLWFTVATALVECSLETRLIVSEIQVQSKTCARMDLLYDFASIEVANPPFTYSIDDWSINIGKQLLCEETGLLTIDLTTNSDKVDGKQPHPLAPTCVNKSASPNEFFPEMDNGIVDLDFIKIGNTGIYTDKPIVSIFPYNHNAGISRSRKFGLLESYVPLTSCVSKNIASVGLRYYKNWDTFFFDDYNMTLRTLELMCENMTEPLPKQVPNEYLMECYFFDQFDYLETSCLQRLIPPTFSSSVILHNMSLLIIKDADSEKVQVTDGAEYGSRTVACPDVSLNISFFLISAEQVDKELLELIDSRFYEGIPNNSSIVIPYRIETISGRCEPALHMLGFSALLYTASLEWQNKSVYGSRTLTYQTFLFSMAQTIFPFDEFRAQQPKNMTNSTKMACNLRQIENVVILKRGWRFVILVTIAVACILIFIVAGIFWVIFPKSTSDVSPFETLSTMDPVHQSLERGNKVTISLHGLRATIAGDAETEDPHLTVEVINEDLRSNIRKEEAGV